jgi:hypothetical protein
MTAAIYARYSSENQRPESIDDKISACRKPAKLRSLSISDDHAYAGQAQSGARSEAEPRCSHGPPRTRATSMSSWPTTSLASRVTAT